MGFKDLVKFNISWPTIILYFIEFFNKYFPRSTLFDAKISPGSYTWQSILKARKVISAGMMRRIGVGIEFGFMRINGYPGKSFVK